MAKIPALKPKQVMRALEKAGFEFIRQKGSHRIYVKGKRAVTVPFHSKDLRQSTLQAIIKQCGLTIEEFLALL